MRLTCTFALLIFASGPALAGEGINRDLLPDGTDFRHWHDETVYQHTWHVDQAHPEADDGNPGTAAAPFRTISRAAAAAGPGHRVLVRAGIYRERVAPERGGNGPAAMVHYQAAPGETVVVSAAERWNGPFRDAAEVLGGSPGRGRVWTAQLPEDQADGYRPFAMINLSVKSFYPFFQPRPPEEYRRALQRRGHLWVDGRELPYRFNRWSFGGAEPGFLTDDGGRRLFFNLGDKKVDPNRLAVEVSVREQCFAPRQPGLGWIRVSGFIFERAANGIPWPQRGALSTVGGHHWIIEDNTVRGANTVGMDIGHQGDVTWRPSPDTPVGGHLVRRNTITDCGLAGICGTGGMVDCLVEDNTFTRIGGLDLEYSFEAAAIKFHHTDRVLIRRNRIVGLRAAAGIWLDYGCGNTRATGNQIADVETLLAGIYIEANRRPIWVDGNLVWNLRDVPDNDPPKDGFAGGNGISVDISDRTAVWHNLVGETANGHWAVAFHLAQAERLIAGGVVVSHGHDLAGNWLTRTPRRVLFARLAGNRSDGQLYDRRDRQGSLGLVERDREARYRLADWRHVTGFDRASREERMSIDFEPETAELSLRLSEQTAMPTPSASAARLGYAGPGPFAAATWERLATGEPVVVTWPAGAPATRAGLR